MLKNIRDKLKSTSSGMSKSNDSCMEYIENDVETACNIIDIVFRYATICMEEDRSKVKINRLEKSFIQSILNDRVKNGIKNFVRNMNSDLQKELMNEIRSQTK